MKIKTKRRTYDEVMALPRPKHRRPWRPSWLFRTIIRLASIPSLWATHFTYTRDRASEPEGPALILMNHSSFLDLKIASRILYPKPYCIVSTTDAMVGKNWLMRLIGCIPTQKFVTDLALIRDMKYALKEKNTSVLMYPEAGYSFDGRATTLPDSLGGLVKLLDVPVMCITTQGAFARDPLYNGLRLRHVQVSADMRTLLTREQIAEMDAAAIQSVLCGAFDFDNFAWQREHNVHIREPFRAEGLERILYKCPACGAEGHMTGHGTAIVCGACGKVWEMDELGSLCATTGETEFTHIPDWFDWERDMVRAELEAGTYRLDVPVQIGMMVDSRALYMVGEGRLVHDLEGFHLSGCDGKLQYEQKPRVSYSLNADFFWYEIGDVVGIGNRDALYYCFPATDGETHCPVAKARLATEELYRLAMAGRRRA